MYFTTINMDESVHTCAYICQIHNIYSIYVIANAFCLSTFITRNSYKFVKIRAGIPPFLKYLFILNPSNNDSYRNHKMNSQLNIYSSAIFSLLRNIYERYVMSFLEIFISNNFSSFFYKIIKLCSITYRKLRSY